MGKFCYCNILFDRSLYIYVPNECKAKSVKLVIRGHELCEYDYQYVLQQDSLHTKLGQRKSRKDLLRVELKLVEYPGQQTKLTFGH